MQIIEFLRKPHDRFIKGLEYGILFTVISYFILLVVLDYHMMGLSEPLILIPSWITTIHEIILYSMIILLSVELVIKYLKIGDPREFVKKHWKDIALIILIPIFSVFKIFKIAGVAKQAKFAKYGIKAVDKAKKHI